MNYYFKTNRGPISIDISSKELLKIEKKRKIVYTCNTNNYSPVDHFKKSLVYCKNHNLSYFVFTDKIIKDLDRSNQIIFLFNAPDPRYAAKIFKILPYLFFKDADFSFWIDANISFKEKLNQLIDEFILSGNDLLLFKHNKRSSVIDESLECIKYGKDNSKIINNQITKYKKKFENLNKLGLFQGRILFRKHTRSVKKMSDSWWADILMGSIRDQLSLPISLSLNKINLSTIEHIEFVKYFFVMSHNKYKMYGIGGSLSSYMISFKSKILYYITRYLR